jgi:hypothetical protein
MDWTELFSIIGKITSTALALAGSWWAFEKWRKRDEHFPRVWFEVSINFIGAQDGQIICELVATLENKGVVPLKIRDFTFVLRGLADSDPLERGGPRIRNQLNFPDKLDEGRFVPEDWEYSFVYPGIKTEYNFVTAIPQHISFVRMQGDFAYLMNGETHHAAKILKVPDFKLSSPP